MMIFERSLVLRENPEVKLSLTNNCSSQDSNSGSHKRFVLI